MTGGQEIGHQHCGSVTVLSLAVFLHLYSNNDNNNNNSNNNSNDDDDNNNSDNDEDCLFVCCLTSQQQAGVSQGRICTGNFTCCHTEIEVADPTFYLTQSQYTDTGPTSPSADPTTPGSWQGSH